MLELKSKRKEVMEKAKAKQIDIHTRSVFLQGLFFKATANLSPIMRPLKPYLEELNTIKEQYKLSTEELALQYVLQNLQMIQVELFCRSKTD